MRTIESDRHPDVNHRVTIQFPADGSLVGPTVTEEEAEQELSPAEHRVAEHVLVHAAASPHTSSRPTKPSTKPRSRLRKRKAS